MADEGAFVELVDNSLDNYLTGNPTLSTVNSLAAGLARPQSSVSQSIGLPPSLLSSRDPHVVILEQPRSRGIRFRYKCEGRSAGSIPGENSTDENRLFPSIKIENYKGPAAIVVVSCVTKDEPHRPHPHTLVGRDCQKGVCTVKLKNTNVASFPSLGIQCMTKREIKDSLKERESIKVDPFGTGFFDKINNLDLNIVRLCFQVFLPDTSTGRFTRIVNPVVSHPIYDKKAVNELVICRLSKQAGHAKGGDEVFMLCEKVNKDDIDVVFYEDSSNGERMWQAYGDFAPTDVHRQFAIVFRTPAYRDPHIRAPKSVSLQLVRKTDGESSDPKPFQYIPDDPDPEQILHKRKRKQLNYSHYLQDEPSNSPAIPTTVSVKEEEERGIPNIRGRIRGMVNSRGVRRMRGRPPKSSIGQQREMFAPVDDSSNMSAQDYSSISGLNQGFDNELTSVPVTALSAAKAAFTPSSVSHSIMAEGDGGGVGMMVTQGGMPIGMLQPLPGSNVPFSFPPKEDVMLSDLESVTNAANGSCLSLQVSDSMLTRYMVDDMSGQIPNDMSLSFNLTNIDMESAPSDTVAQNVTISSDGGKHV